MSIALNQNQILSLLNRWSRVSPSLFILLCLVNLLAEGPKKSAPTEAEIDSLVRELGNDSFAKREQATEKLSRLGKAALQKLQKATESEDPEIRVRARKIVSELRLGITPGWPEAMIQLVHEYKNLDEEAKNQALRQLHAAIQQKAVPFLVFRLSEGSSSEAETALSLLQGKEDPEIASQIIRLLTKPKNAIESKALAWALSQTGKSMEALQILKNVASDENLRSRLLEQGVKELLTRLKSKNHKELVEAAKKFVEVAPSDARFLYLQAEGLSGLNLPAEADKLREQATILNPQNEAPHYTVAEMLGKLGRTQLAIREWETILKIPPADDVYDINAYLRLSNFYSDENRFKDAADSLEKALTIYRKAKDENKGMALLGGDEKALETRIRWLRNQSSRALSPKKEETGLRVSVSVSVKDGKLEELRKALKTSIKTVTIQVEPHGTRILDLAATRFAYDSKKKEIVILLNGSPCCDPVAWEAKEGEERVIVQNLDCYYIYQIDAVTGKAEREARFEKDYMIKVAPGPQVSVFTEILAKINGKVCDWNELQKGVPVDYMPKKLHVEVSGVAPSKKREIIQLNVDVEEPDLTEEP
jgi:tetratricopeptide (TPR) repeat protein